MRCHFSRISFFSLFLLLASSVVNAQTYQITITPPEKEKAPKVEVLESDPDDGWNYELPNQERQYFLINPWQRMIFMPAVARPRVWTNPKIKMNVKIKHSH